MRKRWRNSQFHLRNHKITGSLILIITIRIVLVVEWVAQEVQHQMLITRMEVVHRTIAEMREEWVTANHSLIRIHINTLIRNHIKVIHIKISLARINTGMINLMLTHQHRFRIRVIISTTVCINHNLMVVEITIVTRISTRKMGVDTMIPIKIGVINSILAITRVTMQVIVAIMEVVISDQVVAITKEAKAEAKAVITITDRVVQTAISTIKTITKVDTIRRTIKVANGVIK